jgi:hypothetical protein
MKILFTHIDIISFSPNNRTLKWHYSILIRIKDLKNNRYQLFEKKEQTFLQDKNKEHCSVQIFTCNAPGVYNKDQP